MFNRDRYRWDYTKRFNCGDFFLKGGLPMSLPTTVETIAKKYSMSTDEFISLGSKLALKEKKKN